MALRSGVFPWAVRLLPWVMLAACVQAWGASLAVVPPGPVTDRIEIELRLGLSHEESGTEVTFYWDEASPRNFIARRTLSGGVQRLAQAWSATRGRVGRHRLLAVVKRAGRPAQRCEWPLEVVASATPALPRLQGGWIDLLGLLQSVYPRNREVAEADLRAMFDDMRRLGMATVIITYVEAQGRFFYPSALRFAERDVQRETVGQWLAFDAVETILSQADRNDMRVIMGLGRGGDTYLMAGGLTDTARVGQAVATSQAVATELWQRYGHHRSFYGWYATHEMHDLAAAGAYYDPVAGHCRSLCPEKPFMVAPDGTPLTDSDMLRRSEVDIFCYQDAVGPGYVPGKYTWEPERRLAQLQAVFSDYQRRHEGTRKHLWADLELWEMAGPDYAKPYPAAWERVQRQLLAEIPYVEMVTAYEFTGFMQAPHRDLRLREPRAARLYAGYERWHQRVGEQAAPTLP